MAPIICVEWRWSGHSWCPFLTECCHSVYDVRSATMIINGAAQCTGSHAFTAVGESCAGRDMAKILAIIGLGMPASLLFTAQVAVVIRALCQTQVEPQPPPRPQQPFSRAHHLAWGVQSQRTLFWV